MIGVGASAGGLDAFKKLLTALPEHPGMAFVLIPHLDPRHERLKVELLARHTPMRVREVEDGMAVRADHVYIIPPNKNLAMKGGVLRLSMPHDQRSSHTAIDFFLRSLAEDQHERAIGIVLSGTGSHGTIGLQAIKGEGGLAMVQEPSTAEYDQMPRSAIASGVVDFVLPVEQMPAELERYVQHSYVNGIRKSLEAEVVPPDEAAPILALLRARTKYDFRSYRKKMLLRRIQRRMSLTHVDRIADYLLLLRENAAEVKQLFKDLLIGVKGFFREPEAYGVLEHLVLPQLIGHTDSEAPVRAWVAACATGEEAYSMAMLMTERFAAVQRPPAIQIFATDIDDDALEIARHGVYPESIAADVSPDRLKRFFNKADENHYRVNNQIRECIVFAPQNLISDAPFSRLDFISCRNLLIYLEPEVQQKVIALFHFALKDDGYLMLGSSETIGREGAHFEAVSKKWRIYRRLGTSRRDFIELPMPSREERLGRFPPFTPAGDRRPVNLAELTQRILLQDFAPASVLINQKYEILYLHGATGKYLDFPTGAPLCDILTMVRQGLRTKVRAAVHTVLRENTSVKLTDLRVRRDDGYHAVEVTVQPIHDPKAEGLLLLVFEDRRDLKALPPHGPMGEVDESSAVHQLEYELKTTREDLQSSIEELESSNEELKAANEEMMSMNEELQSANEEFETSKEELQSLNEELSTVNSQLQDKVEELEGVSNDILNLLASTDIATVFLDTEFRIKRFTPATAKLLTLIATDVGRPLSDLSRKFGDDDLLLHAEQVLERLIPLEKEVIDSEGNSYLRRIVPYRTGDKKVEGVVITFVDITERKRAYADLERRVEDRTSEIEAAHAKLEGNEREFRALADNIPALVAYLDAGHRYRYTNRVYEDYFGRSRGTIVGLHVRDLLGEEHFAEASEYMERAVSGEEVHYESAMDVPRLGKRRLSVTYVPDRDLRGDVRGYYSLKRDITELRQAEEALREREERLRTILEAAPDAIITIEVTGQIENFNPAAEKMFGYSSAEVIGRNLKFLMPPPYLDEHDSYLKHYLETGEKRIIGIGREVSGLRRDGSTFPMELKVSEVRLGDRRLFTGIARDITARRETQERMVRSERLAAIGEAMAGLIHESRNALQRSQAGLERLRMRLKGEAESLDLLDQLQRAQEDLHRLYEDVRKYASTVRLNQEVCDLARLVESAWEDLEIQRRGRDALLHQNNDGLDLQCRVDPQALSQVVRNILENSLGATSGEVRVEVQYTEVDFDGSPAVRISFLDHGPGLTPEARERIFDAFFTTKTHGTGLGMAIAQRLVEAHGGTIAVGNPARGAEILVTLPRRSEG